MHLKIFMRHPALNFFSKTPWIPAAMAHGVGSAHSHAWLPASPHPYPLVLLLKGKATEFPNRNELFS